MKNFTAKLGIIWMIYSIILIWFVYCVQGESIILIPLDICYGYAGNRNTLYAIILCLSVLTLFCIYVFMNERKIIRFRWEVKIGEKKPVYFRFGSLKSVYSNINRILCVGICAIIIMIGMASVTFVRNSSASTDDGLWVSYPIAHAMGAIDGYDYTNSLEAFEYNYEMGHRVFEVDFRFTSDGEIVCWHEWNQGYLGGGISEEHIPTLEVFQKTPILGKYKSLTLSDLLLLVKDYEDIYIVTDTKSDGEEVTGQFEDIVNTAEKLGCTEVLDRFLIQIYNDEMYKRVTDVYDFPTIIYTMYHSSWDGTEEHFLHFCRFCKNHGIRYVTMWDYLARPEILKIANDYDIIVFAHTVNDLNEAEALIESGVKGVYTDVLTPDMFLQEE